MDVQQSVADMERDWPAAAISRVWAFVPRLFSRWLEVAYSRGARVSTYVGAHLRWSSTWNDAKQLTSV